MKNIINKILCKWGYCIFETPNFSDSYSPYSESNLTTVKIVDLEKLADMSLKIPGMISPKSGQFLYALCFMQELKEDVVEVGSWQGRSTSFLARAVANSKMAIFCC
jgi:predicted O-methyltransferase YrrM